MSELYEISLQGHLEQDWSDWFGGMSITQSEAGTTQLTGELRDQSELHGVLAKIRDLGMPILRLIRLEVEEAV